MASPARNLKLEIGGLLAALLLVSCSAARTAHKKPATKSSPNALPSSVVFPVFGDVYPHGIYYLSMNIGEPPKPYFLDIDTGSDLSWLQCDAPCVHCQQGPHPLYKPSKSKLVPCADPICTAVHVSATPPGRPHDPCAKTPHQCDYEVQYMDHGSSLGVLVTDTFALPLVNSTVARPSLAFGCGYDQRTGSAYTACPTDGVLGLARGSVSLLSQLKGKGVTQNVIGHCFGRKGRSFMFFGDDLLRQKQLTWLPMVPSTSENYYSPGLANLLFGGRSVGSKQMDVVFDSGSSYAYFASQPYGTLLSMVKADLSTKPLKDSPEDHSLPVCWKGQKPFKSVFDVKDYFQPLSLKFTNGNKEFAVPPENYLIVTKFGNVCFGILNGTEVGLQNLNVIGDIMMQDMVVVYDNEKNQLGWAQATCDRFKSGPSYL